MAIRGSNTTRRSLGDCSHCHYRIDEIEKRVKALEEMGQSIAELNATLETIAKRIKQWGPSLLAAVIASGIFGEQWEKVISTIVNG